MRGSQWRIRRFGCIQSKLARVQQSVVGNVLAILVAETEVQ